MSYHKKTATLHIDDRTFDVHVVEMKQSFGGPSFVDIKANEMVEITKPFPDFVAKRQELIEFAKTGAPFDLSFEIRPMTFDDLKWVVPSLMAEGNVSDALDQIERNAWVDNSPTYSAVLAARDEKAPTRAVPRMTDQKPWTSDDAARVDRLLEARRGAPLGQCVSVYKKITAIGRGEQHGCKRAGGFVDTNCMALCDCHRTLAPVVRPTQTRPESLNAFAAECHAANQHWWHDPATGAKLDRNMGEMLMLVVSEIAEAMEGERKNLMDDHIPHRKMAEIELADAMLRLADIAGAHRCELDEQSDIDPAEFASDNKGAQLLRIVKNVQSIHGTAFSQRDREISWAMKLIEMYASKHGYDLWGAVYEKMDYNKIRADHTPEARKAARLQGCKRKEVLT